MFLLVYVDDIIIIGSNPKEVHALKVKLDQVFSLKDLGTLNYFLGVEVRQTTIGIHLSQGKYISDLLQKVKMAEAKSLSTPMVHGLHLSLSSADPMEDGKLYRRTVGAL